MMSGDDHLDKETAVDLTPTGETRRRKIASSPRRPLCGNAVELVNTQMERRISRDRAAIEGEKKIKVMISKIVESFSTTDSSLGD
jgi:hypothetical protein